MGLRTIVGFRWEERQRYTYNPNLGDPYHDFREARKTAFRGLLGQPFFIALVLACLILLSWGLRLEMEWWVLAAFGFGIIPIAMELACYYFAFLMAATFLWDKRPPIAIGLLVLAGSRHVVTMSTSYYDTRYFCQSLVVIVFVLWATWTYARRSALPGIKTDRSTASASPFTVARA